MITNEQTGTRIDEISEGIYRISTPMPDLPGDFTYYAHAPRTRSMLERLAATNPTTLACMHGSAWRGDGAGLLRALADSLEGR